MHDLTEISGLRDYKLARRGVMMTGLVSGFTLAAARGAAPAIHTDAAGLVTGEARIPTDYGDLPAWLARPAGPGPFPIVLVNEEIFGVHEYIKDVCRRLAKAGYLAVATEYYARLGDLSQMTDAARIFRDVILKAPDARYMADMDATAAWAGRNGGMSGRLGVIGFCRGGRQTWLFAEHSRQAKAAVAFYGPVAGPTSAIQPRNPVDAAASLHCPLLGLYGAQDPGIRMDDVREAEARAKAAGRTVEIVIYPDAGHGFHADYRPSYRPADAADAWRRALAWLTRYGVTAG